MVTATNPALAASIALTEALVEARKQLGDYLLANPGDPDTVQLENLKKQAGAAVVSLTANSIQLLGDETAAALAQLKAISEKGNAFIKKINDIKRGLKIVAAFLNLAAAVLIGDASGVLGAIKPLQSAISGEARKDDKKGGK